MTQPFSHSDYEELLGAYALDAVDELEAAAVERHLAECPRCRDEVARHRDTAALLGHAGVAAPDGLWDRIAGELSKVPPALTLVRAPKGSATPPGRGFMPGAAQGRRRRRISVKPFVALVSVAAVVIGVLGFELANLQGQVNQVQKSEDAGGIQRLADAALGAPGHETVTLRSQGTQEWASAVIAPSGQGYLIDARLPKLSSKQTYQLWGLSDGTTISLGLLGDSPTQGAFNVDFGQVTELMITVEPVGGVSQPNSPVVVAGATDDD